MKGISYGPSPLKAAGRLPNDDFMSDSAKALWSSSGRGDLAIMKKLGANAVRLYGNDPREDHKPFLDEAHGLGLQVIPGMSDYPYTQMPKNCQTTDYNCYPQIKEQYKSNLENGFLEKDGSYHPALKTIIVINEPDLKIPGESQPKEFSRAIISAIDGMLDAEKEAGVNGNLPNFTATFSFGVCSACSGAKAKPSLGQMLELRRAMEKPQDYGYKAKNDLAQVYKTRFTNSFNTNNPATDMKPLFLDSYEVLFPTTPVFIGEYHAPHVPAGQDLQKIMSIARNSSLAGVSFFEFQVRYDKGGSEMEFGMFGLGVQKIASMNFFGVEFPVWCLTEIADKQSSSTVVDEVAKAFEGEGIKANELCIIDPQKVPISEDGYQAVLSLKDVTKMSLFVTRVVEHMGGSVSSSQDLQSFARRYTTGSMRAVRARSLASSLSFASMVADLSQHPSWVQWDVMAACIADRSSDEGSVGEAISYACGKLLSFNCSKLPDSCSKDIWSKADYVLSLYYLRQVNSSKPLQDCNFAGAAMFAPATTYRGLDSSCVITKDAATTALTEEGYQTVLSSNSTDQAVTFIRREVADQNMQVTDQAGLAAFAAHPPASFDKLKDELSQLPWVCGGPSARNCPAKNGLTSLEIGLKHGLAKQPRNLGGLCKMQARHGECLERGQAKITPAYKDKVQAWKDEAAARHRETAELRLEADALLTALSFKSGACVPHSSKQSCKLSEPGLRSFRLDWRSSIVVAWPWRAALLPPPAPSDKNEMKVYAPDYMACLTSRDYLSQKLRSLDVDWVRAKRISNAAWERKSAAIPDSEMRIDDATQRGVWKAIDLAAMAARHAGEVAELQLQHTSALQVLQSKADVSLGRARLAEVRCISLEAKKERCCSMMLMLVQVHTRGEVFAAWSKACQLSRSLRQTKVSMAFVLLRAFEQRESLPRMVLHSWAAVCRTELSDRRRIHTEALLSGRESMHQSRLSWLMCSHISSNLQACAKELFLSWRCVALSAGSRGLHARLRLEEARRSAAQGFLLRLRENHGSKLTMQDVFGVWSKEVLLRHNGEFRSQLERARALHVQESKSTTFKWLLMLQNSNEDALLARAFFALRLETQERVQQARTRAWSAQQASELVSCANGKAVQAVLVAMDRSGVSLQKCAFSEWTAFVHAGKTSRSLEAHQLRVATLQCHFESTMSGFFSRSVALTRLSRALLAWARAARQRGLQNLQAREREQFSAWRLRFVESATCWQGKDSDQLLAFHCWQAWIQFCTLAARDRASAKFLKQLHQLQMQWSRAQILMVGASLQVQRVFLVRACFSAWCRAGSLARALGDRQECQRLQMLLARVLYARDLALQRLASKTQEQPVGFWFQLAWAMWRRLRLERMMIEELYIAHGMPVSLEYEANVASPQGQPALALSVAWAITTHEFVIWNLAMAQGSKHARNATRIRSFHPGNGGKFKSFVLQTKSGRLTNGCGRASGAKARQARVAFTSSSCHKPCLCTGKLSVSLLHVCILLGVQSVVASSNQVKLACVVHVGNSGNELAAFAAIARLVNGTRARVFESSVAAYPAVPWSIPSRSMFLIVENFLRSLSEVGLLQPKDERALSAFSALCGQRRERCACTGVGIDQKRSLRFAIPEFSAGFRVAVQAVLIGSLVRAPAATLLLLGRLFIEEVHYQVFVYTAPIFDSPACNDAIAILLGEWVSARLQVASLEDVVLEEYFQSIVGSQHMRQWFKLRKAYAMMEDHERLHGWKFDLVLKFRTDVELTAPLQLSDFPEVLTGSVVYSAHDVVFFCNRQVAHTLLNDILEKFIARSGNESRLLPLDYGRLLRADEGNAMPLQVFPDVHWSFHAAVVGHERKPGMFASVVRRFRADLEAAHRRSEQGEAVQTVSGHWRFRSDTKQYQHWQRTNRLPRNNEMCSMRHWFYHVHRAEPEVLMRGWTGSSMKLSRTRSAKLG
ncbi:TDP1 [Symbiodinium pilosum]|uniref:TDP1 protein n=1 Tax=Symbiodinium pilosum TaxID=2952 RepID=A0A812R1Q1_SYMPI|nr:TDP1 [Symbiodinium pilosum]